MDEDPERQPMPDQPTPPVSAPQAAEALAASDHAARLLFDPTSVRAFRNMMWGYLLFLPLIGSHVDALGWLVLLLAVRRLDRSWHGHTTLRAVAVCGLIVAGGRTAALLARVLTAGPLYTGLYTLSLILAAVFLWLLCGLIVELADSAGNTSLRRQARWRRWLYILHAALPSLTLTANGLIVGQLGMLAVLMVYLVAGTAITTLVMALLANAASLCRSTAALRRRQAAPQ